jgi:DNA primase (bacterial type)
VPERCTTSGLGKRAEATQTIKAAVPPADAAERYGLTASRNGMTLCPFRDDRHPSARLYDEHFYCFACAAHGDVIDLTAKLLGIPVPEAIRRLEDDFGIDAHDSPSPARPARSHLSRFRQDELLCLSTLTEYERLLRGWKTEYALKTPDDPIDDRFVEACQMLDYTEYLADFLCAAELEERVRAVDKLMKDGLVRKLRYC